MQLTKASSSLLAAAVLAAIHVIPRPGAAQQPPAEPPPGEGYVCTALERVGGHEEPSLTSPPTRMEDGRLRILEEGETAHANWPGEAAPEWIPLYEAQDAGSDSFLGHFPSEFFKCAAGG